MNPIYSYVSGLKLMNEKADLEKAKKCLNDKDYVSARDLTYPLLFESPLKKEAIKIYYAAMQGLDGQGSVTNSASISHKFDGSIENSEILKGRFEKLKSSAATSTNFSEIFQEASSLGKELGLSGKEFNEVNSIKKIALKKLRMEREENAPENLKRKKATLDENEQEESSEESEVVDLPNNESLGSETSDKSKILEDLKNLAKDPTKSLAVFNTASKLLEDPELTNEEEYEVKKIKFSARQKLRDQSLAKEAAQKILKELVGNVQDEKKTIQLGSKSKRFKDPLLDKAEGFLNKEDYDSAKLISRFVQLTDPKNKIAKDISDKADNL